MKLPIVVAAGLALYGVALAQEGPALTPITLQAALAAKPEGAEAERLAERIRTYFGGSEALVKGAPAKIDELTVAWALEAPQLAANAPVPRVAWDPGNYNLPLTKVGTSGLYAGTATLAHGTAFNWHYEAGDRRVRRRTSGGLRNPPGQPRAARRSQGDRQADAVVGEPDLRRHHARLVGLRSRSVQAGNAGGGHGVSGRRRPERLRPDRVRQPDCEGRHARHRRHLHPAGRVRRRRPGQPQLRVRHAVRSVRAVPARGDSAGSGKDREAPPRRREPRHLRHQQRRHLCVHRRLGAARPSSARCSRGSGASPTSPAARRVREGGHNYEAMVRKTTPRKPIRVFLQDGANDLDNANGNWPLANQTLAKSLAFARYDYRFEYGQGFHSNRHGRAILPDSLRWLWRGYKP